LRNLDLGGLIAESINGLFFRNAVSFGFLALECRGIHAAFEEGQTAEISIRDWTVRNHDTDAALAISPVPERLLSLMTSGGIFPVLEGEGLIAPKPAG
jgi:3-isopropylmalate/(R)-2-methylmalate dehydratase small subunit